MMRTSLSLCVLLTALVTAPPALSQNTGQPDASQGVGPLPAPNTAAETVIAICTDRPTKANAACTVPRGDIQIESGFINWTHDSSRGTRTDTILYGNPYVKYGIGEHTDIEANLVPYETERTRDATGVNTEGGIGDLTLRVKQKLTGDASNTQVSILPFLKVPTARSGLGNGKVEGGVVVPVNVPLPAGFTLTLGPEVDILANSNGSGHHAALTMLGNMSHSVGKKLTVYGELYTQQNLDPSSDTRQYSIDVAAAYQVNKTLQFDLGGNFGLNESSPDTQVYFGFATRF